MRINYYSVFLFLQLNGFLKFSTIFEYLSESLLLFEQQVSAGSYVGSCTYLLMYVSDLLLFKEQSDKWNGSSAARSLMK